MSVQRIHEDPRVTKPYTEEQWQAIEQLGHEIDEHLRAGDVRLTMGGEPTFVSIDDLDGDEWNTAALGDTKRQLAGELLKRLRDRFAPGALLHYGQGKWYPGESLPRWALGCYWRRDGVPVWENPDLIADEARDYGHTPADAQRFITALAERLGVDPGVRQPAYEDVWYYLWREQQLPVNVDPPQEQARRPGGAAPAGPGLRARLEPGRRLCPAAAASRPRRCAAGPAGSATAGNSAAGNLFLLPGDSPMGYRLPLDSLPWAAPEDLEPLVELDPFAPRAPLAAACPDRPRRQAKTAP